MKTYIIAEVGVNHNGSILLAKKLIDAAVDAKVDAVKFQIFIAEELVCEKAQKAEYQIKSDKNSNTQLEMLKNISLSFDEFKEIKRYCDFKGIEFLATAFDLKSLDFLLSLNVKKLKIASGEITNLPYLIQCAKTKLPIILSTGMSELQEVADCIKVLKEYGTQKIELLHCTTEYPAPIDQINLKAIVALAQEFNCAVGYSDHTQGIMATIAAVSLGATIIEKHFTLDKNMEGPDHNASLEPYELSEMVKNIRLLELALGNGVKTVCLAEKKNIVIARKSLVAACNIKKGEIFTQQNLTTKRPGSGISPMKWFSVLGQKAIKDFKKDELISL